MSTNLHLPATAPADPHRLRIEVRQGYDMRFRWVLIGPDGSLAMSPFFLRKAACLQALRAVQRRCNATVDDRTLTAPLEYL